MKAMIFAAGKGERMRPLTDLTPKPLLTVNGKPLIDYHLEKLARAGFTQVMINLAYKGQMIKDYCGKGNRYGLNIAYSEEGPEPLETGGALKFCLPWFEQECFAMIAADVFSDFDYTQLAQRVAQLTHQDGVADLALIANPSHNTQGDFSLENGHICRPNSPTYTYSGIGIAKPTLISEYPNADERFPLRDAFYFWVEKQQIQGHFCTKSWSDVGTPERLAALQQLDKKNLNR